MARRGSIWLVCALLAAAPAARGAEGDDAWRLLRELRAALEGRPQAADFEQLFLPAGFSSGERENGRLTLALPDCLRWDYAEPQARSYLLCGDRVWSWNAGETSGRRFTVDAEQEEGLELLRLGVDAIAERYAARLEPHADGRAVVLEPRDDGGEITEARLLVAAGEPRLAGLSYRDVEGNSTSFTFRAYRPLASPVLEPPTDIEWIEE